MVARRGETLEESEDPQRVTRATYDKVAEEYLAKTRRREVIGEEFERFAAALAAGAAVLDVGAGPGFDSARFAARGFRPIAADLSRVMLEVGRAEFAVPRAQCDMRWLPFASGCFGGVWANASLLHLSREDTSIALQEFRRVLEGEGVLHLSLKIGSSEGFEMEPYQKPRWFTRWSATTLDEKITGAGFDITAAHVRERIREDWLVRLAKRRD